MHIHWIPACALNFCYISNFNLTQHTEMSGNGSKHFLAQNLWKVWIILQTALLNCSCMSSRWQWKLSLNRSIYLCIRYFPSWYLSPFWNWFLGTQLKATNVWLVRKEKLRSFVFHHSKYVCVKHLQYTSYFPGYLNIQDLREKFSISSYFYMLARLCNFSQVQISNFAWNTLWAPLPSWQRKIRIFSKQGGQLVVLLEAIVRCGKVLLKTQRFAVLLHTDKHSISKTHVGEERYLASSFTFRYKKCICE